VTLTLTFMPENGMSLVRGNIFSVFEVSSGFCAGISDPNGMDRLTDRQIALFSN